MTHSETMNPVSNMLSHSPVETGTLILPSALQAAHTSEKDQTANVTITL